jgi:multiple sugar transport system permease protein
VAIAVNQRIRGIEIFSKQYTFLPVITSTAIIAIVWTFLFDPDIGLLAYYLKFSRLLPLKDGSVIQIYAMPAVILVSIWKKHGVQYGYLSSWFTKYFGIIV